MPWHPDVPELNISKPQALKELEGLGQDILNAMDTVEIDRRMEDIANQIARAYSEKSDASYQGCYDLISMALSVTGNAVGGRVGERFVGKGHEVSEKATRLVFPDQFIDDL